MYLSSEFSGYANLKIGHAYEFTDVTKYALVSYHDFKTPIAKKKMDIVCTWYLLLSPLPP